jgi:hypothetical protein
VRNITIVMATLASITFFNIGCGSKESSHIQCSCSAYINNVPMYPNDSQDNCAKFGQSFGCTNNSLDPCNDNLKCCNVANCSSACSCPSYASN